jgi:type IV pilus assembly protein PilO
MKFGAREILFVTLMAGLLVATYFLVFAKGQARREALLAEISSKQTALANLKSSTAGIDDLGHKIDELQKAIAFFEGKLPQEREVDKILKEVWQMAEANNLVTRTVKTQKSERGPNYSEQPITMALAGDFNGFYSFLLQLEKLPRITRVTQMKLEKMQERDGSMTASLTLSIFFEPDQSNGGGQKMASGM